MFYTFIRAILRGFFFLFYSLEANGKGNVPESGPVILCSNHISTMDPPVVGIPLERKVHFMAKAELFKVPVLGGIIKRLGAFPVKRGGVSKESIRYSIDLLKSGQVMGIFPEGTRKNPGGMGKKGAAMLAMKSGAAVIPVAIIGTYKPFRKMRIYYGAPVDLREFEVDGSDQLEAATEKIMSVIREMIASHEKPGKN